MPSIRQVLFVVILTAMGGLIQFACYHFNFYLIIAIPMAMGFGVGFVALVSTNFRRVSGAGMITMAIVGTLVATGVYWGARYVSYREKLVPQIQEYQPGMSRDEALAIIDRALMDRYGTTGFLAYLADTAESGFSIWSTVSTQTTHLSGAAAYGYWLLEIAIVLGVALLFPYQYSRRFPRKPQSGNGPDQATGKKPQS